MAINMKLESHVLVTVLILSYYGCNMFGVHANLFPLPLTLFVIYHLPIHIFKLNVPFGVSSMIY